MPAPQAVGDDGTILTVDMLGSDVLHSQHLAELLKLKDVNFFPFFS